jgi:peptidoglycan hydrolase-like protein with peptidoglycan-binding domain
MITPSYAVPGLVLRQNSTFSDQVQDLQEDLRSLGFLGGSIDGVFGSGTARAVEALQFDLMNNDGSSNSHDGAAPVAIQKYNNGTVTDLTGAVDQDLVACIVAMLEDDKFPKLPSSLNSVSDNQAALTAIRNAPSLAVPLPYLLSILTQESGSRHFQVPSKSNRDNFVTIGLDRNDSDNPSAITSRGFGIGQFTYFHHPPTAAEVASTIEDPVKNVSRAVGELREKFDHWVNGPTDTADDRIHEAGTGPLRPCQFSSSDPRFMTDCVTCLEDAGLMNIVAGVTPVFAGATATYQKTQYHVGSYTGVPIRKNIPCDWPYAVRRYNGSGPNSYDYQAEVLQRMVRSS